MSAGARNPDEYVYNARMTNAAMRGSSPLIPSALIAVDIPISWRAIYGIVASTPVSATADSNERDPYWLRTTSAAVTALVILASCQSLGITANTKDRKSTRLNSSH